MPQTGSSPKQTTNDPNQLPPRSKRKKIKVIKPNLKKLGGGETRVEPFLDQKYLQQPPQKLLNIILDLLKNPLKKKKKTQRSF